MRLIFLIIAVFFVTAPRAQIFAPAGLAGYPLAGSFANNMYSGDSLSKKKWSFNRYNSISTSFSFFKGGNATVFSAPMGLQLTRMLNNNLYAFANVTVAPAYINFNSSFANSHFGKTNTGSIFHRPGSLGIYSAASMGLMYVNDDRTFSISGSISIEKSSYPLLPVYPINTSRLNLVSPVKR